MVWGQDKFFPDVIDDILAQGNNVFFLDAPTDHDMGIGVPVFRPQSATRPPSSSMVQIQDSHLLEGLPGKEDISNLPYVMRCRGAVSPTGTELPGIFGDLVK